MVFCLCSGNRENEIDREIRGVLLTCQAECGMIKGKDDSFIGADEDGHCIGIFETMGRSYE